MFPFVSPGLVGGGDHTPHTAFSQSMDDDNSGWGSTGYSLREITDVANAFGGNDVRVTFVAPSTGTMPTNNCGIGVWNGTTFQTVSVPVELLFSGAHGFSISNGATIVSDWVTLPTTTSNRLVVIADLTTAGSISLRRRTTGVPAGSSYYKTAGGATYNLANPSGMNAGNPYLVGFNTIEVRY